MSQDNRLFQRLNRAPKKEVRTSFTEKGFFSKHPLPSNPMERAKHEVYRCMNSKDSNQELIELIQKLPSDQLQALKAYKEEIVNERTKAIMNNSEDAKRKELDLSSLDLRSTGIDTVLEAATNSNTSQLGSPGASS